ncbi:MAG TPA: ABC transporter permease [Campylobacterales bacterium]|nr:ABC transporter permease [Campylobacterales bacterium]HIO71204.1 ABC transporter permease [Campylobacterales bacterium]
MNRRLILFFVKRYLRFDREQPFISLSAGLAFLGIALGVMVLIIAMAIMNGFDKELQNRLFVMNYPLTLISTVSDSVSDEVLQTLEKELPDLVYSPYLVTGVIAKYGRDMKGGFLFGVDFKREAKINPVIEKAIQDLDKVKKFDVVVGSELLQSLYISKGSKITYIFTEASPSGIVSSPKIKRFRVVSSFHSGLISYDETYHYASLEGVGKVLGQAKGQYHGIHIYSKNPQKDREKILKILPNGYRVVGWWEQNGNLFSALEMEKKALFIVLMLIILIASVNIVSSLLMTVMNRRSEIALLISLGATAKEIKTIFLYLGIVIGIGGIVVGAGLGFLGLFVLANFDIVSIPADIYGTSHLPLDLDISDLIAILFGAFVIVILSSLYPAKQAKDIDIVQVLKNE